MSTIKNAESFVKETIARMKGDTDEALAQRNYRKAVSTINQQLAARESSKIEAEETIDDAKEALNKAKYPDTKITDGNSYLMNISEAKYNLESAQENLNDIKEEIKELESLKKEFNGK